MKDLSYLQVFGSKTLRSVKRILEKGFTLEDIDAYLTENKDPTFEQEDFSKMPVSKKYEIFKERNPSSDMTIEEFIKEIRAGRVPCGNCKDRKELQKEM
jgi:DNA-binding transcriptional MerR regulator